MTFFIKNNLQPRKIEIDLTTVSSNSPEVQQRLDRISENYHRLDSILTDVESKIQNDERLSAIDQSIKEIELTERRKKWRPRPKARKKSANPKKPR